jgi:Tfp pilus assembly protein PilO
VRGRRAPLIVGAGVAVLAILFMFFLVLPKMHEVNDTQAELDAAQNDHTALEAQLAALQQAEKDAPQTQQELAAVEEQVPSTAKLPDLILQLQAAADRAAVDLFSFSPGQPAVSASGTYSTIGSQITVNGTYFAVDEFLFLLETLPRAAKVTSISVAPGAGETTATTTPGTTPAPTTSETNLTLQVTVEFYTTDTSAGPGSTPGPVGGATGSTGPSGLTAVTGGTGQTPGSTGPGTIPSVPAPTGGKP